MNVGDISTVGDVPPDAEEQAAEAFAQRRASTWGQEDETHLQNRLAQDFVFADAYRRVEQMWRAAGDQATTPDLMQLREQALARARRANARRWSQKDRRRQRAFRVAAGVVALGVALVAGYHFAPFGWRSGEFRTHIAEQRVIELQDHSHVALDAATQLEVRYSKDARIIHLLEGQAQFTVAHDPQRPFKVQAGDRTIVALGTKFTVEYIDRSFSLSMLEGRVAVIEGPEEGARQAVPAATESQAMQASRQARTVRAPRRNVLELSAGEGLQVDAEGRSQRIARADLKSANAWREGKVIFNKESLAAAVARLNRYSRLRIELEDPTLAALRVSGVFDTGDTQAFIEAVEASLPAAADYSDPSIVRLRAR